MWLWTMLTEGHKFIPQNLEKVKHWDKSSKLSHNACFELNEVGGMVDFKLTV